jgi:hypothetical protein
MPHKGDIAADFTNCRVLILTDQFAGKEGVCVGKTADGNRWAISPDDEDQILQLVFERDFALLIDLSGNPDLN